MHRAIDWYALRQIIRLALLVSLIAMPVPLGHTQAQRSTPIIYVRPVANGTGDGSSWANVTTLQDALRQATAGSKIWVAAGVYIAGADPRDTFAPRNGVALYGGFAGNETSREQRDPSTNLTVLSGDLGADDQNKQQGITPTPDDIVGVNTRNIVTMPNLADPKTIIDGFTITGGLAGRFTSNSSSCPAACGGGIFVANGSPTLRNIHLVGNQARNLGGGIYLGGQSVTLHNLHFSHNRAERGGGLAIMKGLVTLQGVRFEANEARSGTGSGAGGGLFIGDSLPGQRIQVTVRQGYFSGNRALIGAGAIELGQATLTMSESSLLANGERFVSIPGVRRVEALGGIGVNNGTLQLTNVRLAGNEGGALRVQRTLNVAQAGEAQLTNVSIEGNRAETFSGGINCTVCRLTAVNVSIAGNLVQNDPADEPLDLAILYRLRDQVLSASDEGQRLTAAYYAHAGEVAYLLVTDEALRDQAVATVKGWQPAIRALVYGSGAQITLNVEQAAATERFLDALAAVGSPELAQMLASKRATVGLERLIGQSMDDAIRTVIGVDPATLGLAPYIYLPLLRR